MILDKGREQVGGAPCLINIPVVRYLAGTVSESTEKTELIILITPHVIVSLDDVDAVTEEFKSKVDSMSLLRRREK
jgi:general secretion pathway protein D